MDLGYFCRYFSKFVMKVIYLVELHFPRLRHLTPAVDRMLLLLSLAIAFNAAADHKLLRN